MRRTTPRVPSQIKAHLAHQGATKKMAQRRATRKMPRWTTTCPSFKTTSTHLPSFGTCHQALVEAPRKGRQGNKHAVVNMKRSIRMTFGDTPPLKSVNVDMTRRWRQGRILWCPLVLPLQVCQQELQSSSLAILVLMRSWPTSTNSLSKAYVDVGRNMVTNVRSQPRRRPDRKSVV